MADEGVVPVDDVARPAIPSVGSRRDLLVIGTGIAAAVVIVIVLSARSEELAGMLVAPVVVALGWLSAIDLNVHRLPDAIVGPLAIFSSLAVILLGIAGDDVSRSLRALLVAFGILVGFVVLSLLGAMGMGDAKLAYPLSALLLWFSGQALVRAGMIAVLVAGVAALCAWAVTGERDRLVPFGPFMAIGFVVAILLAGGA